MTKNKLHGLQAILHWSLEVSKVFYVNGCLIVNQIQFKKEHFWKCICGRNMSNCAVKWKTAQFEISVKNLRFEVLFDILIMA